MPPTLTDALRLAINTLRDAAESQKMPSGLSLGALEVSLYANAAEVLETALDDLKRYE